MHVQAGYPYKNKETNIANLNKNVSYNHFELNTSPAHTYNLVPRSHSVTGNVTFPVTE